MPLPSVDRRTTHQTNCQRQRYVSARVNVKPDLFHGRTRHQPLLRVLSGDRRGALDAHLTPALPNSAVTAQPYDIGVDPLQIHP